MTWQKNRLRAPDAFARAIAYLGEASENGLRSFEVARLNEAANLSRELVAQFEELLAVQVEAALARLLLEARRSKRPARSVAGQALRRLTSGR